MLGIISSRSFMYSDLRKFQYRFQIVMEARSWYIHSCIDRTILYYLRPIKPKITNAASSPSNRKSTIILNLGKIRVFFVSFDEPSGGVHFSRLLQAHLDNINQNQKVGQISTAYRYSGYICLADPSFSKMIILLFAVYPSLGSSLKLKNILT